MSDSGAWIVTGMSGAGKATAAALMDRAGAVVSDNLPVDLLASWAMLPRTRPAVAVIDARQGAMIADLIPPPGVRVVYLDAADPTLARRLGDSSRPHPCAAAGGTTTAIRLERELLTGLRAAADVVIDTTELEPAELGSRLTELIVPPASAIRFRLTVSSFGFKFGSQAEADWIVDARFLKNPFWEPALRGHTGLDSAVRDFVLGDPRSQELADRLEDLLGWTVTQYAGHGRSLLHVAVGCTGGRHRSVVLAEELGRRLGGRDIEVVVRHRDLDKPDAR